MHKATEELAEATRKADFMINAINPAIRFINRLGQILIAVLGGRMLLTGTMSVGVFLGVFQYVNQSAEPLTENGLHGQLHAVLSGVSGKSI